MVLPCAAAALACSFAVNAQQPVTAVIGFLSSQSQSTFADRVRAFHSGLGQTAYVEGRNVAIEYRWAEGKYDRLPDFAADLVARQVAVIVANYPPVLAAKAATATIPIVFTSSADPLKVGLVASLNRPDGNVTGVHLLGSLESKRLELLHQLVPAAAIIAVLVNPKNPQAERQLAELKQAGDAIKRQLRVARASTEPEIDTAMATLAQESVGALLVAADPFFSSQRGQLVSLAARYRLPAIYNQREYVESGGLISYGSDFADGYRHAGIDVGRILQGAKPGDMPVMQPTKFELVVNLKAAKVLGLEIPLVMQATADEVIE